MRHLWWMALGLAACMPAAEETVVTELRVLSMVAEPPLIDLFEGGVLTSTTFRPDERPVDVLTFSCVERDGGCREAGDTDNPAALESFATVTRLGEDGAEDSVHSFAPRLDWVSEEGSPPAQVWTIACVEGLCPVVDAVAAAPEPGTQAWRDVVADLVDVQDTLRALPRADTAASLRVLPVLALPPGVPRPTNPVVTPAFELEGLTVPSGGSRELTFVVETEAVGVAYPIANVGGFESESYDVVDGEVTVKLVAGGEDSEDQPPLDPGTVIDLYINVQDDQGGAALWRGQATVE